MIIWDYSHPQYNASLDKLNSICVRNRVSILPKCSLFELFFVTLHAKACESAHARPSMHCNATLCTFRSEKHHGPRLTADLSAQRLRNGRQTTKDNSKDNIIMAKTDYKQRTREEVMAWLQKARERKDAFQKRANEIFAEEDRLRQQAADSHYYDIAVK